MYSPTLSFEIGAAGTTTDCVMGGRKLDDFTEKDTEVLVRIVKTAQARNVKGSKGEWKDFLKNSKQLRVGPSDPAKRPWTTLAEFVHTFTDDADIQVVKQIRGSEMRHKRFEEFESGGIWKNSPEQELVRLTYQHRRYKEYYTFPSFDKGWVLTDSKEAEGQSVNEHMISLDCEMVECDDKTKGLVRVCAIDAEYKVLLDMLVKPQRPVTDYLTCITGISEADLIHVTCGFHEAQTAVLKLLTSDTILVGHSLHNDLKALKIDHTRVIDTSFLFQFRNKPECYNAGLNSLCKAILGYEFREDDKPHDCILDATIPMRIVHHVLKHGIKGPIDIQAKMLDEDQLCKLYFHGIPQPVSVLDLKKLIPHDCSCVLDDISWANINYGTTYAVFKNIDDAKKTFEQLKGPVGEDSYGRPQKTVIVTVRSNKGKTKKLPVKVRKMSSDDTVQRKGDSKVEITTTSVSEGNGLVSTKRRKVSEDTELVDEKAPNSCCDHAEEVESLKKRLQERIEEVHALQKVILDLTRSQF